MEDDPSFETQNVCVKWVCQDCQDFGYLDKKGGGKAFCKKARKLFKTKDGEKQGTFVQLRRQKIEETDMVEVDSISVFEVDDEIVKDAASTFKIGDKVQWVSADDDVPPGTVGIVKKVIQEPGENYGDVEVEFPSPKEDKRQIFTMLPRRLRHVNPPEGSVEMVEVTVELLAQGGGK